jgi:thiamine pyrophosphokinase
MKAVLVVNGTLSLEAEPLLRRAVEASDLVVGVDGGTYHLLRLGLLPQIVTGDFDSLAANDREHLAGQGVHLYHTPDQDFTDLDKATFAAINVFGATQIHVFAATGGRLDHIYSVLSTVIKYGRIVDIRLVDEFGETFLVPESLVLTGADLPGRTLSLLALGTVEGITTVGVRWPLDNETLAPGIRDGTLNEIISETVSVTVRKGDLIVMLHHCV